jgi:hypothetical protein
MADNGIKPMISYTPVLELVRMSKNHSLQGLQAVGVRGGIYAWIPVRGKN